MNPKYIIPVSNTRVNINCKLYSRISLRSYANAKEIIERGEPSIEQFNTTYTFLEESIVTCIVFAAFSIESFVNDYAARHLNDKMYYENFDGLPILSKLQLISLLFFEKEFDKSSELYALIKVCFRNRNELVHNKSHDGSQYGMSEAQYQAYLQKDETQEIDEENFVSDLWKDIQEDVQKAYLSLKAIVSLINYVDDHDKYAYAKSMLLGCSKITCRLDECSPKMCEIAKELFSQA